MTKAELLAQARRDLGDTVEPYLWSDAELTSAIQEAEREATERAGLLEIEDVDTYCSVTIEADKSSYDLNTLVYDVLKVRVSGESNYLERTTREKLDRDNPTWEDDTGTPEKYYLTNGGRTMRVTPTPTGAGTMDLVVMRLPVTPMGDSPEIHARHHFRMLDWVYALAYKKRDADTYNPVASAKHEMAFEASFGPRWDATQQKRRLRKTGTIMRDTES